MNVFTRGVVVVSTIVAACVELYLASMGLEAVAVVTITALVAVVVAQMWKSGGAAATPILFAIYLAPAAWLLWYGSETYTFEIAWIVPIVALCVSGRDGWRWSIPNPWRVPLVMWALIVAVSWPIVAMREITFDVGMLWVKGASTNGAGMSPDQSVMWSTYVALGHLVGLLWVDALWRWYSRATISRFAREVAWPLAAAAVVACLIGAYQGFVRIDFLNGHVWPYMNRAAGTLMDANTFGMLAAMWGSGLMALLLGRKGRWSLPLAVSAFCLSFVGVWTSGSRTALAAFGLAGLAASHFAWTTRPSDAAGHTRALSLPAAALIVGALAGLGVLVVRGTSTTTVLARIPSLVPGMEEGATLGGTVWQLWERFGYGTAAMRMVGDHPLQGVGVGGFHTLVRDYGVLVTHHDLAPDNAQNWYRHILAEFGLIGSLGALAWAVLMARRLLSKRAAHSDDAAARVLRGILIAFGLLSLLGVPGQSPPVILTFWTLAFWCVVLLDPMDTGATAPSPTWPTRLWAPVLVVVVAHAALTYAAAEGDLLPRHRADRFGWDYRYGISDPERMPDGTPGRRWTAERSLSTIPVQGRVLKFVAWAEHPDADKNPVHLRVTADSKVVYEGDMRRASAIFLDIPATPGAKELVLETWIDRTFRPSDFGSRDRRDLGLAIQDWRWQD